MLIILLSCYFLSINLVLSSLGSDVIDVCMEFFVMENFSCIIIILFLFILVKYIFYIKVMCLIFLKMCIFISLVV